MSAPVVLLCLKFGLDRALAQSFEGDAVPPAPQASAEFVPEPDGAPAQPSGAVELNALPLFFGKFSSNLEISLASHHALIISPAYFAASYFRGPEAELGYRFYFYQRPLSGPFVGVAILGAAFQYRREPGLNCGPGAQSCAGHYESTLLYGATFEAGWQWIVRDWLLLGVGAGVEAQHAQARKYDVYGGDFTDITKVFVDSGVQPRVLATVGVVF